MQALSHRVDEKCNAAGRYHTGAGIVIGAIIRKVDECGTMQEDRLGGAWLGCIRSHTDPKVRVRFNLVRWRRLPSYRDV